MFFQARFDVRIPWAAGTGSDRMRSQRCASEWSTIMRTSTSILALSLFAAGLTLLPDEADARRGGRAAGFHAGGVHAGFHPGVRPGWHGGGTRWAAGGGRYYRGGYYRGGYYGGGWGPAAAGLAAGAALGATAAYNSCYQTQSVWTGSGYVQQQVRVC